MQGTHKASVISGSFFFFFPYIKAEKAALIYRILKINVSFSIRQAYALKNKTKKPNPKPDDGIQVD